MHIEYFENRKKELWHRKVDQISQPVTGNSVIKDKSKIKKLSLTSFYKVTVCKNKNVLE